MTRNEKNRARQNTLLLCMLPMSFVVHAQKQSITVPVAGNSWVTAKVGNERVGNSGWVNWEQPGTIFSTYVCVNQQGTLHIAATIEVPSGISSIICTLGKKTITTKLEAGKKENSLGEFAVSDSG